MRYAKIDRATGKVLKVKEFDNINMPLNKPHVWIEIVKEDITVYDRETHKAVRTITQPDLSDLDIDVSPTVQRVLGYDVIPLSPDELQTVTLGKIKATNEMLFDMVERIMAAIANNPAPLKRNDFPETDWDVINARLILRGEDSV